MHCEKKVLSNSQGANGFSSWAGEFGPSAIKIRDEVA